MGEHEINAPLRLALGRVYRKMGLLDQALPTSPTPASRVEIGDKIFKDGFE